MELKKIDKFRKGNLDLQNTNRKIPYIIYQTFKTNQIPINMYTAISSWLEKNPAYDYYFYDDNDILEYIENYNYSKYNFNFTKEELLKAYHKIKPGAGKADLFRLLAIYNTGGCYFDVDTVCENPLDDYILEDDEIVTGLGIRGDFHQWALIYTKHHDFIKKTIENCVGNILQETFFISRNIEGATGPYCYDCSIKQILRIPFKSRFRSGSWTIGKYNFRILSKDLMGGNIIFKYGGYFKDLENIGLKYYSKLDLY